MAYTFDGPNKLIVLSAGTITFDVPDLFSRWKEWVRTGTNSRFLPAMRSVGGDPISGTQNLGATFFLTHGWRIRPDEAEHRLTVVGNLYTDPAGSSPFVPTLGNFNVLIEMKVSNLVDSSVSRLDTENLRYMVESTRESHQGFGSQFYVSNSIGSDTNSGTSPSQPLKTIAAAVALAVSGRGDVIYLLAPSAGTESFPANVVIDKEDVHLRGPGRGVQIQPGSGVPVTIDGNSVSMAGIIVKAPPGSTDTDCIVINGKNSELRKMYVVGTETGTGNGVVYRGGDYHEQHDMEVEKCGGSGVKTDDAGLASGSPREITLFGGNYYLNKKDGIELQANPVAAVGTSTRIIRLRGSNIHSNGGYGIYVGANVSRTMIAGDVVLHDNALGDVLDAGISTHHEAEEALAAHGTRIVEGSYTADEVLRIMAAALAGKVSGAGTGTETFKGLDGTTDRIVSTVDANGNRTAVALDGA